MKEIVDFFKSCPALSGKCVREDYLGPEPGSLAIAPDGGEQILKQYTSGDMLGQLLFKILIRENFTGAAGVVFENISEWLINCKTLPKLKNKQAQYIEIAEGPDLVKTDVNAGVYEMKLRLVYYRKGEIL